MKTINTRILKFLASLVIVVMITGCATSAKNTANYMNSGKTEIAYGFIDSEHDGKKSFAQHCSKGTIAPVIKYVCDNVDSYKLIFSYISKTSGGDLSTWMVVPSSVATPTGGIVEFNPSLQIAGFVRVVTDKGDSTCRWTGFSEGTMARVNSGFLAGITLVGLPLVFTSAFDGGVECNGWSYKDLIKTANAAGTFKPDMPK